MSTIGKIINTITTSNGATVSIQDARGERVVVMDHAQAPADMRHLEAGRVRGGGFQPAPDADWALRPETLRAIADLLEMEPDPRPLEPSTATTARRSPRTLRHTPCSVPATGAGSPRER